MTVHEVIENLVRRVADLERRVAEVEAFPRALADAFACTTQAAGGEATEADGAMLEAARSP